MHQSEPGPNITETEQDSFSEYVETELPKDSHIQLRRCTRCGAEDMKPKSSFVGTGLGGQNDRGLVYHCSSCGAEARVPDLGGLFMGALYSLFWGAVALFAIHQGPYWYIRHFEFLTYDDSLLYLVFDIAVNLFALAVVALSVWIIWTFFFKPAITLIKHPVVGENRARTEDEVADNRKSWRASLISFFILPLFLWAPLFGAIWLLDAAGVNVRENKSIILVCLVGLLGVVAVYGKRYRASAIYAFLGMAFWMAIFVWALFTFA